MPEWAMIRAQKRAKESAGRGLKKNVDHFATIRLDATQPNVTADLGRRVTHGKRSPIPCAPTGRA